MMKMLILMMASAVNILYVRGNSNLRQKQYLETDTQVCKWRVSTTLQCLRSRLFAKTVLCYRRTMTEDLN